MPSLQDDIYIYDSIRTKDITSHQFTLTSADVLTLSCRCTELILLSHLSFRSEHIKSLTALKIYCKGKFLPAIHTNKQKHMQERVILGRLCVSCQLCVCVFLSVLHVSRRKEGLQCVGPMNQLLTAYQRMTQRKHRRKHQGKIRRLFGNFKFRYQVNSSYWLFYMQKH